MRRCLWCGAELIGRPDQQYCSPACRVRAHRAHRGPEDVWEGPEGVSEGGDDPRAARRHETPLFAIPDRLDPESRRVVQYVNWEIERWNTGRRTEPIDLILEAARDRLRRAGA
jgi:hypothetical protein